jgi:hypothetical protein
MATGTVYVCPKKMTTLSALSAAERAALQGIQIEENELLVPVWCSFKEYRFGGDVHAALHHLPLRLLEGVKEGDEFEFELQGWKRVRIEAYQRGASPRIRYLTGQASFQDVLAMLPRP